jgi:hypothetical protein
MTRRDQELLDKQFCWLNQSSAKAFLALSVVSAMIVFLLLASASIA